jgi:protein-tyrosine phosphatase
MSNSSTNPFEKRSRERRAFQQQERDRPNRASETDAAPFWGPTEGYQPRTQGDSMSEAAAPKLLLVVCTANICRSPMVVGILQERFQQLGLSKRIEIRSAGVFGLAGKRASQQGIDLLAERGIDISGHVARQLEADEVAAADLIIVMEEAHRQAIFVRTPQQVHKVMLFSELVGRHEDVDDPYRRGRRAYRKTLATIDATLETGLDRLLDRLDL